MPPQLVLAPPGLAKPGAVSVVQRDFPEQPLPVGSVALPDLDEAECQAVTVRFRSILDRLCQANRHRRLWWYTWLSCQDRLNVDLLDWLEQLARLEKLLASLSDTPEVVLACPSPAFADAAAAVAQRAGWIPKRHPIPARRQGLAARWRRALSHPLRWWWSGRRSPCPKKPLHQDAEVLFVSLFDAATLRQSTTTYTDTYFGALPQTLHATGRRTLVLGIPFVRALDQARHAATLSLPAVTIGQTLGLHDLIAAIWDALRFRLDWSPLTSEEAALARDSLRFPLEDCLLGGLVERAVGRCLAANPRARVLTLAENNPWERAVAIAARRAAPPRPVTGYLHCAVFPAHLKNGFLASEFAWRPEADLICTTGANARAAYVAIRGNEEPPVHSACNLRGQDPLSVPTRTAPPGDVKTVLVLLEGLSTMVPFVRFLDHCARQAPSLPRFVVRAHPALPLPAMAALAGVPIGPGSPLDASTAESLVTDIEQADAVFYKGSTAALTAAAMGVPLLRFSYGTLLSDDPLHGCDQLKAEVCTLNDLRRSLATISKLSTADYLDQAAALRSLVGAILARPDDAGVAPFLAVPPLRPRAIPLT